MRLRFAGVALFALIFPLDASERLTAERLWELERLSTPTLSADGQRVVVVQTRHDPTTDKAISQLIEVSTETGESRSLTSGDYSDGNPAFSPDGQWLAFTSQRTGDDAPQVYVLPLAGGEAQRFSKVPTGVIAFRWTPDSRKLVVLTRIYPEMTALDEMATRTKERAESKMTARRYTKAPIRWWDSFIDEERSAHLYLVERDGEPQALTTNTGLELQRIQPGLGSFDVAPDGSAVAFVADTAADGIDPNLDVYLLTLADRKLTNLSADNPAADTAPRFAPSGKRLVFNRQVIKGFYGDEQRLMVSDLRGGVVEKIDDMDRSKTDLVFGRNDDELYGAIDDAGTVRVYRFDLKRDRAEAVTQSLSFGSLGYARSRAGEAVIIGLRQGFSDPGTLVRIDPRGDITTLLDPNAERLAAVELGRYESIEIKGANDAPIQTWVVYPPGFDPAQRHAFLHLLHGGPHNGITDSFTYRWNAHVFAARGYVVAWHNFHGSSGFGQAFTDAINPDQDRLPYIDTIKVAEYFASQPYIDRERMVAAGASYGGYLASILLGREHPFKALVAHAPVYNWLTQYGADYGAGKRRHGEFWEQPELFAGSSPHSGAANFKTPTLVVHGELDYRVPVNHALELFQTLQNRRVPSRLIYFPNENHWILKRQNSLYWYDEVIDWLESYAPPAPR